MHRSPSWETHTQEAWQFETSHLKKVSANWYKASPRLCRLSSGSPACPGVLQCRHSPKLTITSSRCQGLWWNSQPVPLAQVQLLGALQGPAQNCLHPFLPGGARESNINTSLSSGGKSPSGALCSASKTQAHMLSATPEPSQWIESKQCGWCYPSPNSSSLGGAASARSWFKNNARQVLTPWGLFQVPACRITCPT